MRETKRFLSALRKSFHAHSFTWDFIAAASPAGFSASSLEFMIELRGASGFRSALVERVLPRRAWRPCSALIKSSGFLVDL